MSDNPASNFDKTRPHGEPEGGSDDESNGRLATTAADLFGRRTRWAAVVELPSC